MSVTLAHISGHLHSPPALHTLGALLRSADGDGAGPQAEGELHGAAARDHPFPGRTHGG